MKKTDMKSVLPSDSRLKDYILTDEIGHGSHGIVYKAYHVKNISEIVAVKIIESSGNIDSLLIEPELLSKLSHPNIIKLKDFFIYAGKLVLVTEYIKGIDLQSYLEKQKKISAREVKIFLTQMASALEHAHANNIIHRDIKLGNVIVSDEGQNPRFILVDFGISRITAGIQTVKHFAGTYYYMAPEQLRGRPCEQSDLWALGVCAYTLLTGIRPFEGDTADDLSNRILFGIPQFPSQSFSEKGFQENSSELENIIFHLLEKQLINRIISADELSHELAELKEDIIPFSKQVKKISEENKYSTPFIWEKENFEKIRRCWILFWTFAVLDILIYGFVGAAISIGGLITFYLGQSKRKLSFTAGGIALLVVGFLVISITYSFINAAFIEACSTSVGDPSLATADPTMCGNIAHSVFLNISILLSLPFTLVAVHYLGKIKSLREKLFLYKSIRNASQDTEETLRLLQAFIDINPGNMNIRQKYIEMLMFSKSYKEAIVESKISLEIDSYNFGINLLLAHSLFEVGLYDECVKVCDGYLAVSGHCFEFSSLRFDCEKALGIDKNEIRSKVL